MPDLSELSQNFKARLAYREAPPWKKPLLDPIRFVRNQLRFRGLLPRRNGKSRCVEAFHLPRFVVVNGEGVSEEIASYGIYEANLTEAFLRLIRPGQTVVDIGMHLGYYSTLFAVLVGDSGHVHAFEPTLSTREIAKLNVGRFHQVTVYPRAVWSSITQLTFHDYGSQWMGFNSFTEARMENLSLKPRSFNVETTTLDSFRQTLDRPISFVKIDAESAEREIVLGAQNLLRTDRPLLSLEVGDFEKQPSSRGLIQTLLESEYAPWEYQAGTFQPHQLRDSYTYNNLIFAPVLQDLSNL